MLNINELMHKAQEMQQKMQESQAELAAKEYVGKSGGSLVEITVLGDGSMKKVQIDPSLIKADEKEILEDLIVAAYNDARTKSDKASQDSMSGMMGGMGIPAGFKLPF
jgi:DNA-binding YbaB/EbfC family protein